MNDISLRQNLRLLRVTAPSEEAKGRALHRALIALEQRESHNENASRKSFSWLWWGTVATFALVAMTLLTQSYRLLNHRADYRNLVAYEARLRLLKQNNVMELDERLPLLSQRKVVGQRSLDQSGNGAEFQNRPRVSLAIDGSAKLVPSTISINGSIGGLGGEMGSTVPSNISAVPVSSITYDKNSLLGKSSVSGGAVALPIAPVASGKNLNFSDVTSPVLEATSTLTKLADSDARQQDVRGEISAAIIPPDPISNLVVKLSSDLGGWQNGLFKPIQLPSSASPEEVIAQINKQTNLYQGGKLTSYTIIESRQVKIGSVFTAVLINTNLGKKIVILQYQGASVGWWSRVYDTSTLTSSSTAILGTSKPPH